MNIYAGNLAHDLTEDELRQAFEEFGKVDTAKIIKDKYSGDSKGFGFVEMPSKDEAEAAIGNLNGTDLKGRPLTVNEARPRTESRGGGGRGGGRGGSGGGGKGGYGGAKGKGGFGGGKSGFSGEKRGGRGRGDR